MSIIKRQKNTIASPEGRGIRKWAKKNIKPKMHAAYKKFRDVLKQFKSKHPNGYHNIYTALLFAIDFLPIFISITPYSGVFFGILMSVAFFFGIILQGANLKNRYDAAEEDRRKDEDMMLDDAVKDIEDYKQSELATAALYYKTMHHINNGRSKMTAQKVDPHDRFSDDMEYLTNTMEDFLSKFYGYKVCVNIKLLVSSTKVRTFVRGKNNIINRGGEQNVFDLNLKEIDVQQNYSFKMILEKNISCFIEKDLTLINTILDHDVSKCFFCDRPNWSDYFMSTAVFAIRGVSTDQPDPYTKNYEILGFLCIDAKQPTDWYVGDDCMVYIFGAFCSELIYDYLRVYETVQNNQLIFVNTI